ncbi:pyridoxamine 5'-phosphate oxidase [Arboricoccus pini]|nr:pyridoxamine 5'-phosphate oxidase [Arboricoccus pini]
MRINYDKSSLDETMVDPDPLVQFQNWFDEALAAGLMEPNAMALGTVDADGNPSTRMVLLKAFDHQGFVFYTNYESRKAIELDQSRRASLLFWWDKLQRQVRIEGWVARSEPEAADAYFASRPYASRIGALVSPQSRIIKTRGELEATEAAARERYPEEVPRPAHWGGYRVVPRSIEFWQGRSSRLHDRLRYKLDGETWRVERLAP